MDPVTTRDELECSNTQHRAVIAMQVLDCDRLDPEVDEQHKTLRDYAVTVLIDYLKPPVTKRSKEPR